MDSECRSRQERPTSRTSNEDDFFVRAIIFHPEDRDPSALALDRAITRYNEAHPADQWWPEPAGSEISARKLAGLGMARKSMTPEQYHEYQVKAGKLALGMASGVLPSNEPNYIPSAQEVAIIKRLLQRARKITKEGMFGGLKAQLRGKIEYLPP